MCLIPLVGMRENRLTRAFFQPSGKEANMGATTVSLEVSSPEQEALLRQFHGLLQEMEQLVVLLRARVPPERM